MRKVVLALFLFTNLLTICAQGAGEIISELENMYMNYNLDSGVGWKNKNVNISFSAPIITIKIRSERDGHGGWYYISEREIKFDVQKAWYDNRYYGNYKSLIINCSTGIETKGTSTTYSPMSAPRKESGSNLTDVYAIPANSDVIINRLINAFKNLKALSNEQKVKSTPNILDDAELAVQKISFIAPDESGKLKANQTGCIKVEIKNTNSNNALEISCIVNEKNKSELFTFEQYTSIDKISGYDTGIINIPIKASENIDNNTYQFDIRVSYKGRTIKQETLNITTSNPKRPSTTASGTGGTNRNKTVRMRKMSGNTYLVSCKVNGLPLDFIFDTGASSVTLSRKQALFMLRNGYLSKSDIVGSSSYQTASGDIATGMVIKLKKIEISGLVLNNVEATIINSDSAPLLLGQSALSRLGKIQIDYRNSTLTIIR